IISVFPPCLCASVVSSLPKKTSGSVHVPGGLGTLRRFRKVWCRKRPLARPVEANKARTPRQSREAGTPIINPTMIPFDASGGDGSIPIGAKANRAHGSARNSFAAERKKQPKEGRSG